VRAGTRALLQAGLQQGGGSGDRHAAAVGVATLAIMAGSILTEKADERTWRTLPSEISIARARIRRVCIRSRCRRRKACAARG